MKIREPEDLNPALTLTDRERVNYPYGAELPGGVQEIRQGSGMNNAHNGRNSPACETCEYLWQGYQ